MPGDARRQESRFRSSLLARTASPILARQPETLPLNFRLRYAPDDTSSHWYVSGKRAVTAVSDDYFLASPPAALGVEADRASLSR